MQSEIERLTKAVQRKEAEYEERHEALGREFSWLQELSSELTMLSADENLSTEGQWKHETVSLNNSADFLGVIDLRSNEILELYEYLLQQVCLFHPRPSFVHVSA